MEQQFVYQTVISLIKDNYISGVWIHKTELFSYIEQRLSVNKIKSELSRLVNVVTY